MLRDLTVEADAVVRAAKGLTSWSSFALVAAKRGQDGSWLLDTVYPGTRLIQLDAGEHSASRWNTLRALRVLDWYGARG